MKNSYKPKPMSQEEFAKFWRTFLDVDYKKGAKEEIFTTLHSFFSTASIETIVSYRDTFWQLYVYVLWDIMAALPDDVIAMVWQRTVLDALTQDINVLDSLMWELGVTVSKRSEMQRRYSLFRDAFLQSTFPIALTGNGGGMTQKQVIQRVEVLATKRSDSLALAEEYSKLEKELYIGKRLVVNQSEQSGQDIVSTYLSIITFFQATTPDKIEKFVDNTIDEEDHYLLAQQMGEEEYVRYMSGEYDEDLEQIEKEFEDGSRVPSPESIREAIENLIANAGDDAKPELFDEGIIRILQQLAIDFNDESIANLYYFDEGKGSFVWDPKTEPVERTTES